MKPYLIVFAFLSFYSCKKDSLIQSKDTSVENSLSLSTSPGKIGEIKPFGVQGATDPNLGTRITRDELGNVYFSSFPYIGKIDVNTGIITKTNPCFPTTKLAVDHGKLFGSSAISGNTIQLKGAPFTGSCTVTNYPITGSVLYGNYRVEADFLGNIYVLDGFYQTLAKLSSNQTVTYPLGNKKLRDFACDKEGNLYYTTDNYGEVYKKASRPVYWEGRVGTLTGASTIEVTDWGDIYVRAGNYGDMKYFSRPTAIGTPPNVGTWINVPLPGAYSASVLDMCIVNNIWYLAMYPGYILKKTPSMPSFVQIYPL